MDAGVEGRITGAQFKKWRDDRLGLKREQVAVIAGLSHSTVVNFETGDRVREEHYWRMVNAVEAIERGEMVVARLARDPRVGDRVTVSVTVVGGGRGRRRVRRS